MSQVMQPQWTMVFETELGWMALQGTQRGLCRLTFGHKNARQVLHALGETAGEPPGKCPPWMEQARDQLRAYAAGEPVDLHGIPLDLVHRSRFERRVREQVQQLGYGRTISYGELAQAAGAPGAARAVGSVMARNPVPLVIPCHRVLAAGGRLGGYSAPSGLEMKRRLLQLEQDALTVCGADR